MDLHRRRSSNVRIYELYDPVLQVPVRYRILGTEETDAIIDKYGAMAQDRFAKAVLEAVINNLKTDVTTALRRLSKVKAQQALSSLYNGAVMLNPGLDVDGWFLISNAAPNATQVTTAASPKAPAPRGATRRTRIARNKITKQKFLNLERHLKDRVIGQDEAIDELVRALRRNQAGLGDEKRPVGVFMLVGASGIGKTLLARELHEYLYGDSVEMIRIDCGEYQHKHENVKLLGAPYGYVGFEEGGLLSEKIAKNPQTVVLLDEIEKAHPDLFNTFLTAFDEGQMTDAKGQVLNFREAIFIATTNLGNGEIVDAQQNTGLGFSRRSDSAPLRIEVIASTDKAIKKHFLPELLNRFDKIITLNHLTYDNYIKIAELDLNQVQLKLDKRGFVFKFDDAAIEAMVKDGMSHVQGARRLSQLRRDRIEDPLAELILTGRYTRGTVFQLTYETNEYHISVQRPVATHRSPKLVGPSMSRTAKRAV